MKDSSYKVQHSMVFNSSEAKILIIKCVEINTQVNKQYEVNTKSNVTFPEIMISVAKYEQWKQTSPILQCRSM